MGTSPPPPSGGDEHDPPFFPTGFAEGGYFDEPLWAITSEYDHPELVIDEGDPMNNGITTEPTMLPLRGPGAVIPLDDMPPEIAPFEDYQTAAGFNDEPFMPAPQPRGFLDHLGMAAATAQFPQPKGFGEGLLGGALRGFGQARMSPIMQEQERRKYAAEQNRKNAEATAKARLAWSADGRKLRGEKLKANAPKGDGRTPEQKASGYVDYLTEVERLKKERGLGKKPAPGKAPPKLDFSPLDRRALSKSESALAAATRAQVGEDSLGVLRQDVSKRAADGIARMLNGAKSEADVAQIKNLIASYKGTEADPRVVEAYNRAKARLTKGARKK